MNAASASSGSAASNSRSATPASASERGMPTVSSRSSTRGEQPLAALVRAAPAEPVDPGHLRVLVGRHVARVAGGGHELRRQRRVVAQDVRQEDAVGAAVRDAEARADRVRERVADADERVREREARESSPRCSSRCAPSRSDPSAHARGSASRIRCSACMQNASVKGDAKIETPASSACVSASTPVSAVSERRHRQRQARVDDGHVGHERVVDQRQLARADGEHRRRRDLRARPGRRRHRDEPDRVLDLREVRHALARVEERQRELGDRQLGALVEEPHGLGRVEHRAAADARRSRSGLNVSSIATPART